MNCIASKESLKKLVYNQNWEWTWTATIEKKQGMGFVFVNESKMVGIF